MSNCYCSVQYCSLKLPASWRHIHAPTSHKIFCWGLPLAAKRGHWPDLPQGSSLQEKLFRLQTWFCFVHWCKLPDQPHRATSLTSLQSHVGQRPTAHFTPHLCLYLSSVPAAGGGNGWRQLKAEPLAELRRHTSNQSASRKGWQSCWEKTVQVVQSSRLNC